MWAIAFKRQDEFYLRSWTPSEGSDPDLTKYEWTKNIDSALKYNSKNEALDSIAEHNMEARWMIVNVDIIHFGMIKKAGYWLEGNLKN